MDTNLTGSTHPQPAESRANYLTLHWSPSKQLMSYGDISFVHEGPITTHPSHDLAHLLIAATGTDLLWMPSGSTISVKIAEYNAVFLEDLLSEIYNAVDAGTVDDDAIISRTYTHMKWFAEEHFAPFPIPYEEACRLFSQGIDIETIGRLTPYFFALKKTERQMLDCSALTWNHEFLPTDRPEPSDEHDLNFKNAVIRILDLVRHASRLPMPQPDEPVSP